MDLMAQTEEGIWVSSFLLNSKTESDGISPQFHWTSSPESQSFLVPSDSGFGPPTH